MRCFSSDVLQLLLKVGQNERKKERKKERERERERDARGRTIKRRARLLLLLRCVCARIVRR